MQIRTIGKPLIDNVLSQIVERYEAQFPGRIRACYLTGSYAEDSAVEWSDIDVYVLFKDAFVSGGEVAQAEQLGLSCASLTPLRLDLHAGSEQSQDSLPGFVRAAVKHTSVLLYGEDTRKHMSLPGREEYTRDATEIALKFLLWLHRVENVTYPLAYPDPDGAFFGYDQLQYLSDSFDPAKARPGIRLLVESACRIGTALLAFKTDCYVSTKRESVQTYRELINDEWTPFLEAMFERGKLCWSYNLPENEEERAELRMLCERMLPFENHYLRAYRAYLLAQPSSNNEAARQFALQGLKQVIYPDE
ncbi:MAG TPA: nucleotidyltransferase domain-containing protein [Ktedonobacteraceae bacterium]|nr:nucleotidyltransferase domain-containing protein [Ktedonobacteraceae bacterium]